MISLRPYQQNGKEQISTFFQNPQNKHLLFVMPTGTGKTTLFSSIAQSEAATNSHVLLVVHRIELVEQIYDRLKAFGLHPGVIADGFPVEQKKIQVASIQTLARKNNPPPADWIIIDECHHAKADSYKKLWGIYPRAKIVGFTATPVRLDGQGFKDDFQVMMNLYPLQWFFDNNHLVRPEHHICSFIDEPIKCVNGEYEQSSLSSLMCHEKYVHDPLKAYLTHAKGKKAVVFCVDIKHSELVCEDFNRAGIPAAHIDGKTPKEIRNQINNDFKAGVILVLLNYDIVSEGYDVPDIEVVILARRTKSLALYLQWIGRGLRKSNGKTKGLILDCAGLWLEHKAIAGDDFNWSLDDGKPKKKKEKSEEVIPLAQETISDFEIPILGTTENGVILNMETAAYRGEVTLLPITSDLRRIIVFEAFIHAAKKKNHKLLSAVFSYKDYLTTQKAILSENEITYCKSRMKELRVDVKDGFWYHLKNNSVATAKIAQTVPV
jgi:superfamily II DNA or RNA helicase